MVSGVIGAALTAMMFNAVGLTALMNFDWMNHLVVGGFAFWYCIHGNRSSFCCSN